MGKTEDVLREPLLNRIRMNCVSSIGPTSKGGRWHAMYFDVICSWLLKAHLLSDLGALMLGHDPLSKEITKVSGHIELHLPSVSFALGHVRQRYVLAIPIKAVAERDHVLLDFFPVLGDR